jgi:H+/Cl- antiporter ClcA
MSPLILFTTLITHLLGGSAGREGTAVQIGASMASTIGTWFKLDTINFRVILIAGMAGGFGAVFGTPFAGAIFAIEVLVIGKLEYKSFIPALFSSLLANQVVMLLGIHHSHYTLIPPSSLEIQTYFPYFPIHFSLVFKIIVASLAFGLSSRLFSTLIYSIKNTALKFLKPLWIIPILGGILIISLSLILGTSDYLGLGVHPEFPNSLTISSAFGTNPINPLSWFWKTIFTALTLGTGFKGGEVTPLFYIGACLGNTLATWFHAPWSLFAALGFIGVFSGATKTPLASAFLGIELFGPNYALYFIITCMIASYFSGKSGIYSAQKRISDFR